MRGIGHPSRRDFRAAPVVPVHSRPSGPSASRLHRELSTKISLISFLSESRRVGSTPRVVLPHALLPHRMPDDDVTAELERLRAEHAQLKRTANRGVSLKVSEKGGVSVYDRFPVTLYQEQWTKRLDIADDIRAFIPEQRREPEDEELTDNSTALRPCRRRTFVRVLPFATGYW